jgi:hypothetical protein
MMLILAREAAQEATAATGRVLNLPELWGERLRADTPSP